MSEKTPLIGKGTTPTCKFKIKNADLSTAQEIVVSFADTYFKPLFKKYIEDVTVTDNNIVSVWLSQEETLSLPTRFMVQVDWTYQYGNKTNRGQTHKYTINTERGLHEKVIE